MRPLVLLVFAATVLFGCGADVWEGFVYPNKNDLTRHRALGAFASLEECRAAARRYLADLGALERGDYECGRNCKASSSLPGIKVCDETVR